MTKEQIVSIESNAGYISLSRTLMSCPLHLLKIFLVCHVMRGRRLRIGGVGRYEVYLKRERFPFHFPKTLVLNTKSRDVAFVFNERKINLKFLIISCLANS